MKATSSKSAHSTIKPASPFSPRYDVIEKLGEGGVAIVYKVIDRKDGGEKALKALKPTYNRSPRAVSRFEDEFRILRSLAHPSLPGMYDYGITDEGTRFMVMEYVQGEPLDEYFIGHADELWLLLYQIVEALEFIHEHDLLHLDLKPENVLVRRTRAFGGGERPLAMLIDFGLSYRREKGGKVSIAGTPAYMAPEIISGEEKLTRAVDYYSLGVTLYELIEGRPPFEGSTEEVLRAHLEKQVSFASEKLEYAELYPSLRGLMNKEPPKRFEAFEELRRSAGAKLSGKIRELERAYGMGYVESLGIIGKKELWDRLLDWVKGVSKELRDRGEERKLSKGDLSPKDKQDTEATTGKPTDLESKIKEDILKIVEEKARMSRQMEPKGPVKHLARVLVLSGPSGSGKSFLLDALKGECLLHGVSVCALGDGGDYEELVLENGSDAALTTLETGKRNKSKRSSSRKLSHAIDPKSIIIDRFVRGWERLQVQGKAGGAVLISDDYEHLPPEEREFLEYAGKRIELAIDDGNEPGVFLVVSGRSPRLKRTLTSSMLKGEKIDSLVIPLPGQDDVENILAQFHGRMAGIEDRKRLGQYLTKHRECSGAIIEALRKALLSGALGREGGKWRFSGREELSERVSAEEEYYRLLLSGLEERERSVLEWLSSNRGFLERDHFLLITGLDPGDLEEAFETLKPYRIVEKKEEKARVLLGIGSEVVRASIYRELSKEEREKAHKSYLELFSNRVMELENSLQAQTPKIQGKKARKTAIHQRPYINERTSRAIRKLEELYEAMGFHYERLHEWRNALLTRVKALRLLKSEKDVFGIRRLCAEGIKLARSLRGNKWKNRKWHIERNFIKEWIEAEWMVDNYGNLIDVIGLHIYSKKRKLPISFFYKYGMALARSGAKRECKELIAWANKKLRKKNSEPYALVLLVRGTLYYLINDYKASLISLNKIFGLIDLSPTYSIIAHVYLMLNYKYLGMINEYDEHYERVVCLARKHMIYDVLITASYAKIESLFIRSLYVRAKRELKSKIIMASRFRVYRTLYEMYFLASAVYYEEQKYVKALNYLNKAIQLAQDLGFKQVIINYRSNYVLIYEQMGRYGDAMHHAERSMNHFSREQDIHGLFYRLLVLFDLCLLMNSSKASVYKGKIAAISQNIKNISRLGYYHFLFGYYYYKKRAYDLAYNEYMNAIRLYSSINQDDDVVRSYYGLISVCLETGFYRNVPSLLEKAKRKLNKMESIELKSEYYRLNLAYHYMKRTNKTRLKYYLKLCEGIREQIKDARTAMDMDVLLFRTNARLGNTNKAMKYLRMYHSKIRNIVSNLDDKELRDEFIDKSELIKLAEESKLIMSK